ncbi:type II secretion system protein [Candidatus Parcubacteria bacterium]|nr:type II secretion system protein [Candidatus Parcubacteria bacterium]
MTIKKYSKQGFTLIELLVVIAVIGVLTSMIFSFTKAKDKARNTRIVIAIREIKPIFEMIYDDDFKYDNICNSPDIRIDISGYENELTAINDEVSKNGGEAKCYADGDNYCVYSKLNVVGIDPRQYFCVDSTGNAVTTPVDPGILHCKAGSYTCP